MITGRKEKDEYEEIGKYTEEEIKTKIIYYLLQKKKVEATELTTQKILHTNYIYTIRDDNISEVWIYKEGIYVPQGITYIKEFCRKVFGVAYTTHIANSIVDKIQTDTYIDQEEFFKANPVNFIAVQNGILDLTTKELKPFTPEIKFFNKLPMSFKSGQKCEQIINFLKDVLASDDDLEIIQECFGYLLWKEYFLEVALMLNGSGRNGKGKTISLMKNFIGAENCAEIPLEDLEKDIFCLGELFKKMANLCGDLSKTALKNTGNFKKLTGRDLVSAARKFKTRVHFVNYGKLIFAANDLPITYDLTEAFFNRWIIIDFPFIFLDQDEIDRLKKDERDNIKLRDPNKLEKISTPEELSGLLNWALDGLDRLRKNKCFSHSPSTSETKNKWLRRSDSCQGFIMDYIEGDFEEYMTKQDFKRAYIMYCSEHKLKIMGDKTIKNTLSNTIGAYDERKMVDGVQQRVWVGVKLKNIGLKEDSVDSTIRQVSQVCPPKVPYSKKGKFVIEGKQGATLPSLSNFDDYSQEKVYQYTKNTLKNPIPLRSNNLEKVEKTYHACSICQESPCNYLLNGREYVCDDCVRIMVNENEKQQ